MRVCRESLYWKLTRGDKFLAAPHRGLTPVISELRLAFQLDVLPTELSLLLCLHLSPSVNAQLTDSSHNLSLSLSLSLFRACERASRCVPLWLVILFSLCSMLCSPPPPSLSLSLSLSLSRCSRGEHMSETGKDSSTMLR